MALLAWAGMVLWAAAPLQAQEDSATLLETLKTVPLEGGVSYGKLADCEFYLIHDGETDLPACIILVPGKSSELAELTRRFARAYRLEGYKGKAAKDGSAVLLMRAHNKRQWKYRGQQGLFALADEQSIWPTIEWLNTAVGGGPARMKDSKLYWKENATVGKKERSYEVELDISQGAPCCVDVSLRVPVSAAAETLSESMRLRLDEVSGGRAASLRRKIGTKPLAFMSGSITQHGDTREGGICLLKSGSDKADFRLGEVNTLQKLGESGRRRVASLPEAELSQWADEMGDRPQLASENASPDSEEEEEEEELASVMSPEEARKVWAESLKGL